MGVKPVTNQDRRRAGQERSVKAGSNLPGISHLTRGAQHAYRRGSYDCRNGDFCVSGELTRPPIVGGRTAACGGLKTRRTLY